VAEIHLNRGIVGDAESGRVGAGKRYRGENDGLKDGVVLEDGRKASILEIRRVLPVDRSGIMMSMHIS
jgi:hypothetical protein